MAHVDDTKVSIYKLKTVSKSCLEAEMAFDPVTGEFMWSVHVDGYEIVEWDEIEGARGTELDSGFYRPGAKEKQLLRRGVVRAKGAETRSYQPIVDTPGFARRLASIYVIDPVKVSPRDAKILEFVDHFGLLTEGPDMAVRDIVYTSQYLHLFTQAIDYGRKAVARKIFNERVAPSLTVRLVGSKKGKPTANWTMEVEPTNLMSAAWLQIASELTQDKRLKKCEAPNCLDWFPFRQNKRFCNNRCKLAFHRSKKFE